MKSNYIEYKVEESDDRIKEILKTEDKEYEELNYIPSRDRLTFNNGFYVMCTALFVDIRNSSELPNKHKRPTLAKIYRSYISEIVAVINDNWQCNEVNIHGDAVWGVFDTTEKAHIDSVFATSAQISSAVDLINCRLQKKGIDPITIGIGLDYGRALMIKAGYKGSGINEVVWMGDVVNSASNLCGYGNKSYNDCETMVSSVIYTNLNDHNKKLLSWNNYRACYHGNIINTYMDKYTKENCK